MLKSIQRLSGLWFGFLIWPFGVFLYSIRNILNKHYQKLIIAFSFLYGYTVYPYSGDIINYREWFSIVASYNIYDYLYILQNTFSTESLVSYQVTNNMVTQPDVFAISLQFLVSRFTENPRWFWGIVSVIYTSFMFMFVNQITKEVNWLNKNFGQLLFFAFLLLVIPFYVGVTGVRFWPALFLFCTYLVKYIYRPKAKYIGYAALSILIHYSFFVPVAILLIKHLLPDNRFFYRLLVVFSLMIFASTSSGYLLSTLEGYTSIFNETVVEERVNSYTDQDVLQQRTQKQSQNNWYVSLRSDSILYFLLILTFMEISGFWKFHENEFTEKMFPYLTIFFCVTLLTINLGSIGRFKNIFYLLALSRYVHLFGLQPWDSRLRFSSYILFPILILYILVTFRAGFYTIDPLLLIHNVVTAFFLESDLSLSEFLVGH